MLNIIAFRFCKNGTIAGLAGRHRQSICRVGADNPFVRRAPTNGFFARKEAIYMQKTKTKILKLIVQAMFAALAFLSMFVINFKVAGFLTLDLKDTFITISAMAISPVSGAVITVLVVLLEFLTMSSTGPYGLIMNLVSSLTFSVVVSLLYRLRRTRAGAYLSLGTGVLTTTAVMLVANLIVTPFFTGSTVAEVAAMIPTLLLPFNFIKYVMNAALIFILYKPISQVLKRGGIIAAGESLDEKDKYRVNARTVLSWVIGLVLIAVSVVLLIVVLGGDFYWVRPKD